MEQTETSSEISSSPFHGDTEENQKLLQELKIPVETFSQALAYMEKNTSNFSTLLDALISKNIINSEEKLKVVNIGNHKRQIRELTNICIKNGPDAVAQYLKILCQIQNESIEQVVVNNEASSSSSSETEDQEYMAAAHDTEDAVDGGLLSALKNVAVPQNQSQQYRRRFKLAHLSDETLIDESLLEEILQYIQLQQQQELHYNPSQEFVALRFRSQNEEGTSESHESSFKSKAVNPNIYHGPTVQRFTVNRPIFIQRIGFFGPHFKEANHHVTSYEIKVKIIVWVDGPIIIAINREIVEVEKGHKMYVEFPTPVPIRPHLSHWVEFTIKGREKLFVQHRKNRIIDAVPGKPTIFKPPYKNTDENDFSYQGNKTDSGENRSVKNTGSTPATSSSLENETPENSNPKLQSSLELTELDLEVKQSQNDNNAPDDSEDLLKESRTWIDFDSQSYWTCQISEIWFYQGNDRIPADAFPCPHKKIKNRFKKPT